MQNPKSCFATPILRLGPMVVAIVLLVVGVMVWTRMAPAVERVLRHDADVVLPDGVIIAVQLADTEAERERGLGGVQGLAETQGMLFLFPVSDLYTFWMKDVHFPIDIVWIQDGVVVDSKENALAQFGPVPTERYIAEAMANMVLELPVGAVAAHGLRNGARLDIHLPSGYTAPTN